MVSLVNTKYSKFFCTKFTKYKEMAREGRGKLRGNANEEKTGPKPNYNKL